MEFELPNLETERLRLRKLSLDDLHDMFSYTSNKEVAKYVTWNAHRSLADTKVFIDFVLLQYKNKKIAPWGIEWKEKQKLIGTIDFVAWQPNHMTAEIGYALSEDYWNRGIVTEAAKAVLQYGFEKMDLTRIQARCFPENIGSERVMQKIGMSYEGTMRKCLFIKGKHYDIKLYSILKDDYGRK